MKKCNNCNKIYEAEHKFCPNCGSALSNLSEYDKETLNEIERQKGLKFLRDDKQKTIENQEKIINAFKRNEKEPKKKNEAGIAKLDSRTKDSILDHKLTAESVKGNREVADLDTKKGAKLYNKQEKIRTDYQKLTFGDDLSEAELDDLVDDDGFINGHGYAAGEYLIKELKKNLKHNFFVSALRYGLLYFINTAVVFALFFLYFGVNGWLNASATDIKLKWDLILYVILGITFFTLTETSFYSYFYKGTFKYKDVKHKFLNPEDAKSAKILLSSGLAGFIKTPFKFLGYGIVMVLSSIYSIINLLIKLFIKTLLSPFRMIGTFLRSIVLIIVGLIIIALVPAVFRETVIFLIVMLIPAFISFMIDDSARETFESKTIFDISIKDNNCYKIVAPYALLSSYVYSFIFWRITFMLMVEFNLATKLGMVGGTDITQTVTQYILLFLIVAAVNMFAAFIKYLIDYSFNYFSLSYDAYEDIILKEEGYLNKETVNEFDKMLKDSVAKHGDLSLNNPSEISVVSNDNESNHKQGRLIEDIIDEKLQKDGIQIKR